MIPFLPKRALHLFTAVRTFVDVKVKWVRDPYLDFAVEREKDLRPALSLHRRILSSNPNIKTLSLSLASLLKPQLGLSIPTLKFFQKYPSVFTVFQPGPGLPPHVRLTRRAISLNYEEASSRASEPLRRDASERLARFLMLAGANRAPIKLIQTIAWDLGLAEDFITCLVIDFPEYFNLCEIGNPSELGLEIIPSPATKSLAAASEMQRRSDEKWRVAFPMSLPPGFDLPKKVVEWLRRWQALPYISPYENGLHLEPSSDQAEKWVVAVVHELLWLTVAKKMERERLMVVGEWLGLERASLKKAIVHHPEIFYVSNKLRTQTVVLREAYRKDFLLCKHPLMALRYRYISLLNSRVRHNIVNNGSANA